MRVCGYAISQSLINSDVAVTWSRKGAMSLGLSALCKMHKKCAVLGEIFVQSAQAP